MLHFLTHIFYSKSKVSMLNETETTPKEKDVPKNIFKKYVET